MYKGLMVLVSAACATSVWLALAMATSPASQSLAVSRHTSVALSDTRADAILEAATAVLQRVDGAGDMKCDLTLGRSAGALPTFVTPPAIASSTSYRAACKAPGRIHVVSDITYCGGACPDCVGCSDFPGQCITVVRHDEGLEGILWAHEYGHNVGNDDGGPAGNVMHGTILAGNVAVTANECGAFLGTGSKLTLSGRGGAQVRASRSLDEFVRTPFIHGVPYEDAVEFGPPAVERLLAWLNDPPQDVRLSNVVLTLGMIGDRRAIAPLQQFIIDGDAALSRDLFVAKRSALVALGYLYFRTPDQAVLSFLMGGTQPAFWSQRIRWRPADDRVRVDRALALMSIQALGVTGSPEAANALRQPFIASLDQEFAAVAADATQQNEQVRQRGVAAFTRQPQ